MIDWGNLITGFGFRFRSLVKLATSGYLLAAVLPRFGFGESGLTNLANVAHRMRLLALGDWIENAYQLLGSGSPNGALVIVLGIWLALICMALLGEYKEGVSSNLMPNAAIAAACIWALWVDLVSPGTIVNLAMVAIVVTLIVIAWTVDHFRSAEGFTVAFIALIGIVVSFVYVVIAPPLWLAGSDNVNQVDAFERGFNAGRSVSVRDD
ncbi:hypothetical protein BW737_005620 [Actinomyces ruminis]|uniref:SPW repeat-containing protein n=1 Tax=Actinomyces ruminis TaxID=1937003 RepID=A0ABX4MBX5_9ACTO|nr:hypothetical protein BW737_005620 [Actinomyces ruminis]